MKLHLCHSSHSHCVTLVLAVTDCHWCHWSLHHSSPKPDNNAWQSYTTRCQSSKNDWKTLPCPQPELSPELPWDSKVQRLSSLVNEALATRESRLCSRLMIVGGGRAEKGGGSWERSAWKGEEENINIYIVEHFVVRYIIGEEHIILTNNLTDKIESQKYQATSR